MGCGPSKAAGGSSTANNRPATTAAGEQRDKHARKCARDTERIVRGAARRYDKHHGRGAYATANLPPRQEHGIRDSERGSYHSEDYNWNGDGTPGPFPPPGHPWKQGKPVAREQWRELARYP